MAQGIKAALNGEPVMTAVNMAPVSKQVMNVITPYFELAERLGCAVRALADGAIKKLEITYNGEIADVNTKMVTTAVIKGMLDSEMEKTVNYVNAPGLAKERGLKVNEIKDKDTERFANIITVTAYAGDKSVSVQGTLFGDKGRIIKIDDNRVDLAPQDCILICPHINRPGVIGQVGSIMGAAGVNISGMQVGTTSVEGTSLMILTLDKDVPKDVIKLITSMDGIFGAKVIVFDAN